MKLVPESLNELHQFERGKDPRKAMDIGMNPLVKKIDSDDLFLIFQINNLASGEVIPLEKFRLHPFYSGMDPYDLRELYERGKKYHEILNPYLKWIGQVETTKELDEIIEKYPGKYLYDFTPEGNNTSVVVSDVELPAATPAEVAYDYLETLEGMSESIHFQKGQDPKRALRIGKQHLIPEITSEDLEAISVIFDSDGEIQSFEDFVDFHGIEEDDLEEAKADYDRFQDIIIALEGDIEWGEYKDWKEFGEVRDYLKNNTPEDKPYIYNAFPGGDGIQIVFSSVELPSAEEIDPDDDAFDPE